MSITEALRWFRLKRMVGSESLRRIRLHVGAVAWVILDSIGRSGTRRPS